MTTEVLVRFGSVRSECCFYHLDLMLYMGFGNLIEVDCSFTPSCLSLTNISIFFFVYTQLSRVSVWTVYPYTSMLRSSSLTSNRLNKTNQFMQTTHLPAPFRYNSRDTRTRIAHCKWPHDGYFRTRRIAIITLHLRAVAVPARSCPTFRTRFSRSTVSTVSMRNGKSSSLLSKRALTGHRLTAANNQWKELNPGRSRHAPHRVVQARCG